MKLGHLEERRIAGAMPGTTAVDTLVKITVLADFSKAAFLLFVDDLHVGFV